MDSEKQASDVTYAVTPGGKQAEITQDQTCYVKGSVEVLFKISFAVGCGGFMLEMQRGRKA